jgi:succinoglycan biosynthesis protein ExoL
MTTVDSAGFVAALERNQNMVFEGDYVSPTDLRRLYSGVDFSQAFDLDNAKHNSRWLPLCRFYEAGLSGLPCLAVRGSEIGGLIDELDVGWTFADPLENSLVAFFRSLTEEDCSLKRDRLMRLPTSVFVSGEDIAALCRL